MIDLHAVNAGFSRKAEVYDAYCEAHPVIRWVRAVVRNEVERRLGRGGSILELNAGTGADAAYFADKGFLVHATDVADGMVDAIREKAVRRPERLTAQQLSFTELQNVEGAPFDLVFSNFGGLNCIPDLRLVTKYLDHVLKPGGHVVWVVMPPVCPWELAQVLRGQFRLAARRFHREGIPANVEGAQVMTWYHSPKTVRRAFGPGFRPLHQRPLSLFCPPSYMDNFPRRFPRLTEFLLRLDAALGGRFPFRGWGDFVMYTFRHEP
jgi:ubiquinone/menaquinone biosynthesis C-methylase UbiE